MHNLEWFPCRGSRCTYLQAAPQFPPVWYFLPVFPCRAVFMETEGAPLDSSSAAPETRIHSLALSKVPRRSVSFCEAGKTASQSRMDSEDSQKSPVSGSNMVQHVGSSNTGRCQTNVTTTSSQPAVLHVRKLFAPLALFQEGVHLLDLKNHRRSKMPLGSSAVPKSTE